MNKDEKMFATPGKPCSIASPKSAKRCATESLMSVENTSTPYYSSKKRLVLEYDKTPVVSPISKSTSQATILSTPGKISSSPRTINITRGIQTITPKTTNRYCQVSVARIRKPTTTVDVQTEECLLCPSQPPRPLTPLILIETGCQTNGLLPHKTAVGTTQTESLHGATGSSPPLRCATVCCQTDVMEESTQPQVQHNENAERHRDQDQEDEQQPEQEAEEPGSVVESISSILNDIAKQYGIDLQSPDEKRKKKKKSNTKTKAMEIEQLQECLANKTYKAIASKVNKNMSNIIEKHMTVYGRETVASRQRLIRWTKQFIRRQQQDREAIGKTLRKTLVVRKIVRVPKQPSVEEKAVQCAPELVTAGTTVGTQWERQKPTVKKKTPVPSTRNKATLKPTSTDSKTCSAGSGTKCSMRQTKLSSYAEKQNDEQNIQGRQQREQQGEHSPKPSKSAAVKANTPVSSKATQTKKPSPAPPPPPPPPPPPAPLKPASRKRAPRKPAPPKPASPQVNKKKGNNRKSPAIEIRIEETPSPQHSEPEHERKYLPYRSPPHYPTQCSKSTETSFLTPTRIRNISPELMEADRQSLRYRNATEHAQTYNPSALLSPMQRMYVESNAMASRNRPEYNTFLVPLRSNESVPPTPSARMMYMNPPERRVLLRSGPTNGGLVREKPPEVSIISSQQLYSQIGLAVEKALKNKTLPSLATMYGEPFIEVFNGCEEHTDQNKASGDRPEQDRNNGKVTKQQHATVADKFVCSSGKDDANVQGSQQCFRPPFHTERSPSLSPIIYQDENSDDEIIL
uniref:Uncharacterized protein n=1 Tax=Anopheles funestus TaxID=62324 RepID=A0A182RUY0_ANOFN